MVLCFHSHALNKHYLLSNWDWRIFHCKNTPYPYTNNPIIKLDGGQVTLWSKIVMEFFWTKKETIEEIVVGDRTSPMTNPWANEPSRGGLVLRLFQKDECGYSTQKKIKLVHQTCLLGNTVSSVTRAPRVAPLPYKLGERLFQPKNT